MKIGSRMLMVGLCLMLVGVLGALVLALLASLDIISLPVSGWMALPLISGGILVFLGLLYMIVALEICGETDL